LELRKKRQGRRLKAAAPNKRPNDPIPCIRLLQQNLPISEVVASFDRFVLTSEQKGFFGNLLRIVSANPSSR
jgi:hypothetical protein